MATKKWVDREKYINLCVWGKRILKSEPKQFREDLERVALRTLWQNRVISHYRSPPTILTETEGRLFNFVLLWYLRRLFQSEKERQACTCVENRELMQIVALDPLPASAHQLQPTITTILSSTYFTRPSQDNKSARNPFISFLEPLQEMYPSLQMVRKKLHFLEEEDTELAIPIVRKMTLPDPEEVELALLADTLQGEGWIAKLMQPLPVLTHYENFYLALLHARLWLLNSELPVCYGYRLTYKDLRGISEGSSALLPGDNAVLMERIKDTVPSILEIELMSDTVDTHSYSRPENGRIVYHMKLEDYSDQCPFKEIGTPLSLSDSSPPQSQVRFQLVSTADYDEDDFEYMVGRIKSHEPPRVLRTIAENGCLRGFSSSSSGTIHAEIPDETG